MIVAPRLAARRGALTGEAAAIAAGTLSESRQINLGNAYWHGRNPTRRNSYWSCGHYPPH